MTILRKFAFIFILYAAIALFSGAALCKEKPRVAITFDDGTTSDMPGYENERWNRMILDNLAKYDLKAVFFATGGLSGEKGSKILQSWNDAGHKIANHTFSHKNYSSSDISLEFFKSDFLKMDAIVRKYSNFYPYFRYPYLKEGETRDKIAGFRDFLEKRNYKIGHVTIDNSAWYINSRLVNRLKSSPGACLTPFKEYYIAHLLDRAAFYDSLGVELTGRQIPHILLLHHNLAAALFLDDLIEAFIEKGWEIVDADEAFEDEIYDEKPDVVPAGQSLLLGLAREKGLFDKDSSPIGEGKSYIKTEMDSLGL